tara:strand:- start:27800 stop:27916 length:117 start_codon:yes stop_codon:yes gene_type:complete
LYRNYVIKEFAKWPYTILIVYDKKGKLITVEVSEYEND